MRDIFLVLGGICLIYYLGIVLYAGFKASFSWFWVALGLGFLLLALGLSMPGFMEWVGRLPGLVKGLLVGLLILGICCFLFLEGCVISGMTAKPQGQVDYLIVLGAQVRGDKVSRALEQRLVRARDYLIQNEEVQVILSGGQGPGETITEAEAMEAWLMEAGIDPKRIRREDRATNTAQNLRYSMELIEEPDPSIGIVSNDFHMFRALHIAKAQNIEAQGLAAPSDLGMYPHYMVREAFAVLKALVYGNMEF